MFIMFFVIFLPCNCPSRNRRQSRGPRSIQQGPTKAFGIVEVNGLPRWDHVLLGEILPGYTRILQSFYLNMVISYIDIGISRFIHGYHILSIIHINKKGAPDFLKTPTQPENMTRGIQGIWIKYPGLRSSWAVKSRFFQGLDGKNGAQVGTTETVDDMFMFYVYAHLYIYINIIYIECIHIYHSNVFCLDWTLAPQKSTMSLPCLAPFRSTDLSVSQVPFTGPTIQKSKKVAKPAQPQ